MTAPQRLIFQRSLQVTRRDSARLRAHLAGVGIRCEWLSALDFPYGKFGDSSAGGLIRRATEQLARISGPAIGSLLNVTFGNATELILALFVLAAGHPVVVKAQITGSIVGNSFLGLGLAILVGTWGREKLGFHRKRASLLSSLLFLSVIGLLVPALFDYTERNAAGPRPQLNEHLSLGVSCVLLALYVANLFYTFITHRDVFRIDFERQPPSWSLWTAIAVLGAATGVSAIEAQLVARALELSAASLGLSPFFSASRCSP